MTPVADTVLRTDAALIAEIVPPGSHVLDLGCGDGALLARLIGDRGCTGHGVDLDEAQLITCLERGLSVTQFNLDEGLGDYPDNAYDYVILNQTLQVVTRPERIIAEMLRVGRRGIVGFPNFSHWKIRWQLGVRGIMPRTPALPFEWYDTPNIHQLSVHDFDVFCEKHGIEIVDDHHRIAGGWRNGPFWRRIAGWASESTISVIAAASS